MHSAELYWRNRNMVATQDWVQGGTEHQDHAGELKVHRYSWAPLEIKGCRYMPIERVHRHPNKYTWSICKLLNSQHSIHFICACIVRRTPLENIPKVMQTWETVAAVWFISSETRGQHWGRRQHLLPKPWQAFLTLLGKETSAPPWSRSISWAAFGKSSDCRKHHREEIAKCTQVTAAHYWNCSTVLPGETAREGTTQRGFPSRSIGWKGNECCTVSTVEKSWLAAGGIL